MIRGRVHKFRDNIDTDAIIPVTCANVIDPIELGKHCMENIDPDFVSRVSNGDIIVAGKNFGCGSSREIAPWSIKGVGIACVIAESFARIFFRNAINIALPLIQCPEGVKQIDDGDVLEINFNTGEIRNVTKDSFFIAIPYPDFIQDLISYGGLVEYTKKKLSVGAKSKAFE